MSEVHVNGEFIVAHDVILNRVGSTSVANISGMVVETVGNGESKKEIFSYFDLEVWDKAAEYVEKNLRKGDTIIVNRGTPRQNRWEKDGVKYSKTIFRVLSFRIIPKKEHQSEQGN